MCNQLPQMQVLATSPVGILRPILQKNFPSAKISVEVLTQPILTGILRNHPVDQVAGEVHQVLPREMRRKLSHPDVIEFVMDATRALHDQMQPDPTYSHLNRRGIAFADHPLRLTQLMTLCPRLAIDQAREYLPLINEAMLDARIDTPARQAAFLSQLFLESNQLTELFERPSRYTGRYFQKYDGRKSLGNVWPGDGARFKGRGFIHLTGRSNYTRAARALGVPLVEQPELAAEPRVAARIAAWFWSQDGGILNALADQGAIRKISQRVNGGTHGLADRIQYYRQALDVLSGAVEKR